MRLAALCLVVLTPALPFAPGAATAATEVRLSAPQSVDPRDWRGATERDLAFRELGRFLKRLGDRQLPPGQSLTIELLDVRPAGQFEPWRRTAGDVRVLRDTTPPRIRLGYRLTEGGRTLARGEETISDINYLWNIAARASSDRLAYEKETLRDWFRDRIVKLKPVGR